MSPGLGRVETGSLCNPVFMREGWDAVVFQQSGSQACTVRILLQT